uniref:Uncharacterized protein n=1 Tax=Anguilla anguilla TaxID=7936 RepID=A0A0E9PBC6_ANGAN
MHTCFFYAHTHKVRFKGTLGCFLTEVHALRIFSGSKLLKFC